MGPLSSGYNDRPTLASRAYDRDRDGFVISGGGGVVVLEEFEHAKARGARIYGEVAAYAATSDRSEEHTSELQSLMRISYAVFCLKKKQKTTIITCNSTI